MVDSCGLLGKPACQFVDLNRFDPKRTGDALIDLD
jgi:hypothetical protein